MSALWVIFRQHVPRIAMLPAALTAILLVVISGAAVGDELLKNPGFDGYAIRGIAAGWRDNSSWADVGVEYSQDNNALSGKSEHIRIWKVASGAVQFVQSNIPLNKGTTYEIGIWARGDMDGPLEILLRQRGKPYRVYASRMFRLTSQWKYYSFPATVGVNDPDVFFMVRLTSSGNVWLDNASVKPVALKKQQVSNDNRSLVVNGSFEIGLDRWAVKVRESGGYRYQMPIEFLDVRPMLVGGDVPHGRQALSVSIPAHGRAIISTKLLEHQTGRRYTLSLWLKSDRPGRQVSLNITTGFGDRANQGRDVIVGTSWKRYELSAMLSSDRYHLVMETTGQGSIYVDAVQIVASDSDHFQFSQPVEIGFTRTGRVPLFYSDEQVDLQFCMTAYVHVENPLTVRVVSTDIFGVSDVLLDKKFAVDRLKNTCRKISLPLKRNGYFSVQASVENSAGVIDKAHIGVGVLSRAEGLQEAASPFGGHAKFSPENLQAARMLGVSWLRMHPPMGTKWYVVEPTKGQFRFYDKSIKYARRQGFHILGSLHGTPRWASSAPPEITSETMDGFPAYPPKSLDHWEEYVSTTVSHYKGVIDDWEVWNEPDSSGFLKLTGLAIELRKPGVYVDLVASAYKVAKVANPNARIIAGSGMRIPPVLWIRKIIDRGVLDYLDILSFHFYTGDKPVDDRDISAGTRVSEIRTAIRKKNITKEIPLWETESGYSVNICEEDPGVDDMQYCVTPVQSVAFVVRSMIAWVAAGVDRWFFYNMNFPDRTDRPDHAGFFTWDRSPTPLALGYAVLSRLISGMKYMNALNPIKGVKGAEFKSGNSRLRVLWATDHNLARKINITLPIDPTAKETDLMDAMGNLIKAYNGKESLTVGISSSPVYLKEVH